MSLDAREQEVNEEIEERVAEEKADAQAAEERYNRKAQAAEEICAKQSKNTGHTFEEW